ncbi:MAG: hypothetical protein QXV05_02225 [Candidatus Korarchaeum sp.]
MTNALPLVNMAKIAEKMPGWISKILLPEIRTAVKEEVSNQLKAVDAKLASLDAKIEERTKSLEKELVSLRNEMNARLDSIEEKLSLLGRLSQIEAKVERLERQVGIQGSGISRRQSAT